MLDEVFWDGHVAFGPDEVFSATDDGGGPSFINGAVAAVTSFGERLPVADVNDRLDSSWGEAGFDVRVSAFREFILDATGDAAVFVTTAALGDINTDGQLIGLDVAPFVDVLLNGTDDNATRVVADMNSDGDVNGLDVDPFLAAVVGGVQQIPEPSTLLLALVTLGVVGAWRKWGVTRWLATLAVVAAWMSSSPRLLYRVMGTLPSASTRRTMHLPSGKTMSRPHQIPREEACHESITPGPE